MDIVASRQEVVDMLEALEFEGAPLRVVATTAKANPPCVLVSLDTLDHYNIGGECVWRLYLMAPYTDDERSIEDLNALLAVVLPHVSPSAATEYVGVPIPEQTQPVPALLLRISHTV